MTKQIVPMFIGPLKENFIERMFRIFDSDDNGYIDFKVSKNSDQIVVFRI